MENKRQCPALNNNDSSSCSSGSSASNITYTLYLYREELQRRNVRIMRLSRAKVTLTDKLISKNVRQIHECSVEDLRAINREMMFRKHLKWQISRMRQLQEQGYQHENQHQHQQQQQQPQPQQHHKEHTSTV